MGGTWCYYWQLQSGANGLTMEACPDRSIRVQEPSPENFGEKPKPENIYRYLLIRTNLVSG